MRMLDLAKALLCASAILVFGAIAISLMTQDAWLALAHAAGLVGAVIAAIAVLLMLASALRRWRDGPRSPAEPGAIQDHELGQTGWD